MDVQVVRSQGQNSGVKIDGAFLPRILLSGFLLVCIIGDSAFPGLQTSVRRGTSLVYSAPRAAAPRCRHNLCQPQESCWGPMWVLQTSVRRGAGPVYSAPRAAAPRCWQNHCTGHKSHGGHPCDSSTGDILLRERPEFV